jgi:eukaryotic-like serine/threonine-protein kinase
MVNPKPMNKPGDANLDATLASAAGPPTKAFTSKPTNQDTHPQTIASTLGVDAVSNDSKTVDATVDFNPEQSRVSKAGRVTKIGGYEILSELGRGGMGVVYKAYQRGLDRTVALKMVLSGAHASEEQLRRFILEAKAVGHLQHPNIVQVFDIGDSNGLPFFSLEFVDGSTLTKLLAAQPQLPTFAATLAEKLARAMAYAHERGILHRDLKPANVLMTKNGTPKIADFGLAKQIAETSDSSSTRTGTIMGTPSYMAPEQARGDTQAIGSAADQYSIGAILYEMLTGRPPFVSANPMDTIMQVIREEPIPPRLLATKTPIDLETICLKSLQKDIGARYRDCLELAEDLHRFTRGEPIQARPVGHAERLWRWCKRNPWLSSNRVGFELVCSGSRK